MSKYHGRIISNAIISQRKKKKKKKKKKNERERWGFASATADMGAVPQVIFTRNAAVKADKKFKEVVTFVATAGTIVHVDHFGDNGAQWIIDEEMGALLGATFVGQNVAELIHGSTVAIVGGFTIARLAHAVPCFPSMSEVDLNFIEAAGF